MDAIGIMVFIGCVALASYRLTRPPVRPFCLREHFALSVIGVITVLCPLWLP